MIRGVRSRGAQCAYAPPVSKQVGHMPPLKFEIVCFCPSWKKLSGGEDGADSKKHRVTSLLLIFSRPPKIHCYNPYLFLSKLNLSYQICVGFIFIYQKSIKGMFKTGFLNLWSSAVNSQYIFLTQISMVWRMQLIIIKG